MEEAGEEIDIYEAYGLTNWPDILDRDAAVEAMDSFWDVVGDDENVTLILAPEFEKDVKEHLEPEMAAAFVQERGPYGRVRGKAIAKPDGSQVVIVDLALFLVGAPNPEPTLRHEALHVALCQRGESSNNSRETIADHDGLHPDLVAIAGIAAEEYRVDRSLARVDASVWSSFEALARASHDAIHRAALAFYADHDLEAIWRTVIAAFSPMTVQAAYVAVWLDSSETATPDLNDAGLHGRILGTAWSPVIAAFRKLPPAHDGIAKEDLDALVIALAHCLDAWLGEMGFGCALEGGQTRFDVYEHEDWVMRGLAATDGDRTD